MLLFCVVCMQPSQSSTVKSILHLTWILFSQILVSYRILFKMSTQEFWSIKIISHQESNSTVGIHPKMARAPKIAANKNYPKNILREEKHAHRIVLALPKPNIAFKTTK